MKTKILTLTILTIFSTEFFSCSGGTSSDNPLQLLALAARAARVIADSRNNVVLQGAVNGPGSIKNATVQVFPTPANGQCAKDDGTINGTPIASTTSDDDGNYTIKYKKTGTTVCVVVTPTGTSQIQVFSPAARANIPRSWSKGNLMAVINEPPTANAGFTPGNKTVNVNPFTRMTARRFSALSAINPATRSRIFMRVIPSALRAINSDKNQKVEFANNTTTNLLDKASEDVENAFFPNRDKNTFSLEGADPNSNAMKLKLGTIGIKADKLGGAAADGNVTSDDIENVINFMEEDFSDGRFDGKKVDDATGKIASMTTDDFGGVVASKQAADDFLKKDFKAAQSEYDSYDSSLDAAASDLVFCETDSLDPACSIAVLPGSPPEMWLFDNDENFIDIGDTATMGGVGFGTYGGSKKTWYMTIVNGGGSDLKLTLPLTIGGSEFVVTEQPNEVVAAGDATYFTVEFTPAAVTNYTTTMSIASNDTLYSPYAFTFAGSGQDLSSNIALWWSFDAGDATDDGPNGYTGTENSSASSTDDRLGFTNAAFLLDNTSSDDISYSSAFSTGISNITISAWVAPDDFSSGSGSYTIINRGTAGTPDFTIAFTDYGNNIEFTANTTASTTLNYPVASDNYLYYWTHIAAVLSGNQMLLYVDGVLVAQTTCTAGNISNSTDFIVGSKAGTDYFSGAVDDVRVYHRALTASQIAALANQD